MKNVNEVFRRSAALLLLSSALATTAVQAQKPNPYMKADDSWIEISGMVESVDEDGFVLDYGSGVVLVEMDDYDPFPEGYQLKVEDKVTVSGRIDDDFFEATSIEASSVYVENLGTTFFASSVDEEGPWSVGVSVLMPMDMARTVVKGTVTEVNDEEFVINTGARKLTVEVEDMTYNPLDDEGFQKIKNGDRVWVSGHMDDDLFEGRELVADAVVTLNYNGNMKKQ